MVRGALDEGMSCFSICLKSGCYDRAVGVREACWRLHCFSAAAKSVSVHRLNVVDFERYILDRVTMFGKMGVNFLQQCSVTVLGDTLDARS